MRYPILYPALDPYSGSLSIQGHVHTPSPPQYGSLVSFRSIKKSWEHQMAVTVREESPVFHISDSAFSSMLAPSLLFLHASPFLIPGQPMALSWEAAAHKHTHTHTESHVCTHTIFATTDMHSLHNASPQTHVCRPCIHVHTHKHV